MNQEVRQFLIDQCAIRIGKLLKAAVRPKLAKEYGCPNAHKKENEKARHTALYKINSE